MLPCATWLSFARIKGMLLSLETLEENEKGTENSDHRYNRPCYVPRVPVTIRSQDKAPLKQVRIFLPRIEY